MGIGIGIGMGMGIGIEVVIGIRIGVGMATCINHSHYSEPSNTTFEMEGKSDHPDNSLIFRNRASWEFTW